MRHLTERKCVKINILSILLAIFIFGFLVFIHESGHFFFARLFGVTVNEFSIGMGPKLLSRKSKKSGIVYSLRALPFGGFVAMAGEDDESDDENAFYKKSPIKRIVITAAGAVVNILLGIIVMTALVFSTETIGSTVIGEFVESEVEGFVSSEEQGLAVGDRVTHINGTRVFTANELHYEIMRQGIKPLDITLVREGETMVVEDVSFFQISEEGTSFGMRDFRVYAEERTFVNLLKHSVLRSYSTIKMVYDSLYDLITGRYGVDSISGPIGVTEALSEAASSRIGDFIYLSAFLSINLGVMNLLPFPALDGGRIVFQLFELIFRRPVPVKVEGFVNFIGLALLMLLIVIVTCKDIVNLVI